MTMPRVLIALFCLAAAAPAPAAADVRVVSRDVPVGVPRTSGAPMRVAASATAPIRFNLVGIHWRGRGTVEFRTATRTGAWSAWRPARPEAEDGPDPASAEADRLRGWKLGNPWWTGAASRIQYRTSGRVNRLRAHFLRSAPEVVRTPSMTSTPTVIRRSAWGANEAIVRGSPSYADRLKFAVVHHTAGAKPSTREESAAIVRGIQAYHVLSNGWSDIGYNFLVDRFGQVFEGRAGGITSNVVGAHAQGFNTGSVGVAAIGNYGSGGLSSAGKAALVRLLAWRLDLAHVDPTSRVRHVSLGSPRYSAGTEVTLNAIGGHRDTGLTSCPGSALYAQLPEIRGLVDVTGLPKLYSPRVTGEIGGPVRFRARLSTAGAWSVTVTTAAGAPVATGSGSGTLVDWTWSSTGSEPGAYYYRIAAGPNVRPATGLVGTLLPFELRDVHLSRDVITPNGDAVGEATTFRFTLTVPASTRVVVRDDAGAVVTALLPRRWLGSGPRSLAWAGARADGTPVPDGRYEISVEATAGTETLVESVPVIVDRTLGGLSVAPLRFSPNADGRRDVTTLAWTLARAADIRVVVRDDETLRASLFAAPLGAGPHTFAWDGTAAGLPLADGRYTLSVAARTALGTRRLTAEAVVDTIPARISHVAVRRVSHGTRVAFTLREPAWVRLRFGERTERLFLRAGARALWRPDDVRVVGISTRDRAANTTAERVFAVTSSG